MDEGRGAHVEGVCAREDKDGHLAKTYAERGCDVSSGVNAGRDAGGESMIVGVPDHYILMDTAIGWMNLAWDIAIDEARAFQDTEFLYNDIEHEHGADVAKTAIAKHWNAKRLSLNNAVSLLQQSLEITLKASQKYLKFQHQPMCVN
jgi:hypothetical protein